VVVVVGVSLDEGDVVRPSEFMIHNSVWMLENLEIYCVQSC